MTEDRGAGADFRDSPRFRDRRSLKITLGDFGGCIQWIAMQRYGSKPLGCANDRCSRHPRFLTSSNCRRAGSLVNLAENSKRLLENWLTSFSLVFGIARP